jgi:hypothetical protein
LIDGLQQVSLFLKKSNLPVKRQFCIAPLSITSQQLNREPKIHGGGIRLAIRPGMDSKRDTRSDEKAAKSGIAEGGVSTDRLLECYIGSFHNSRLDPVLENEGLTHGMVAFAIPSLGILFKCRADGDSLDLEFGAFFSLLKFIKTSLKDEKVDNLRVHSSNPEFVFAFTPSSRHLAEGSTRRKLLLEYVKGFKVAVSYVEQYRNKTRVSPADCPAIPEGRRAVLEPDFNDQKKTSFKPFQRGVKL